jgi:hypothetical protein
VKAREKLSLLEMQTGRLKGGGQTGCQTVLFPDHYLHGLLSGNGRGRLASCLISVGGYGYFCDLCHSIWLFVLGTIRPPGGLG